MLWMGIRLHPHTIAIKIVLSDLEELVEIQGYIFLPVGRQEHSKQNDEPWLILSNHHG